MKLLCIFILVVVIQPCAFFIIPRTINQKVDIYLYATLKLNFTNIRNVDMASPHSDKVRDTKSSPFKNQKKNPEAFIGVIVRTYLAEPVSTFPASHEFQLINFVYF